MAVFVSATFFGWLDGARNGRAHAEFLAFPHRGPSPGRSLPRSDAEGMAAVHTLGAATSESAERGCASFPVTMLIDQGK